MDGLRADQHCTQGGSTEPFWFKNNQNNKISQTSQSHQFPPASMLYPGDVIPYVYPGDPTPQMARPVNVNYLIASVHITSPILRMQYNTVRAN